MRILPLLLAACSCVSLSSIAQAQQTAAASSSPSAESCEQVAALNIANVSISAKAIAAGEFVGAPQAFTGRDLSAFYKKLPAFCQVVAHARPSSDSDIVIEVWMPMAGWNGKLQGLGNGGFAGLIDNFELGASITKGYAAVATDTGHTGSPIDAKWALGHPEKIADFGHRGIHEMTRVAKSVVQQFYGTGAKRAYFAGCSDGGREALMEAQRYPDDYDGILAGAPANYWTALLSLGVVVTQAVTATPASFIPQSKIPAVANAVKAACDKLDGVSDGILNDPRECHFDPATIECKNGEDSEKCLTTPQVAALNKIYAGLRDSKGHEIFPGYLPGAEDGGGGWGLWITGPAPARSLMAFFGIGYFSDMVYDKTDWSYKSFELESGLKSANEKSGSALNAINPDLTAFRAHGGKLILYHGWEDPAIPSRNTVNYYNQVETKLGRSGTDSFVRLYMVPGMQHCGGGPGPDTFGQSGAWIAEDPQHNARIALEDWVEKGTAPDALIATRTTNGVVDTPALTRPLCPYPQSAKYSGSGDPNKAESFTCANPGK